MESGYGRQAVFFFFLLLLAVSPHKNSSLASRDDVVPKAAIINFIKTSCTATFYPKLCFSSLSAHANKIQTNPRLLAGTAIHVALSSTVATSGAMVKLLKSKRLSRGELGAVADCVELVSYSIDELKSSLREMRKLGGKDFDFELRISNIQTWVSAALTDETTCVEGFAGRQPTDGGVVKVVVRRKIVKIARLTSNALALVNRFADLHG